MLSIERRWLVLWTKVATWDEYFLKREKARAKLDKARCRYANSKAA